MGSQTLYTNLNEYIIRKKTFKLRAVKKAKMIRKQEKTNRRAITSIFAYIKWCECKKLLHYFISSYFFFIFVLFCFK